MRILLDESLPRRLRGELPGHAVKTVAQMGWSSLENGELLRSAADQFDVFVTADQNLQFQQNLSVLPIAVAVLIAHTNKLRRSVRWCQNCLRVLRHCSLERLCASVANRAIHPDHMWLYVIRHVIHVIKEAGLLPNSAVSHSV